MTNLIYLFIVLAVAMVAMAIGFRRGFTGQIASILGFGFGGMAARVLTPEWAASFQWAHIMSQAPEFTEFTASLICAVVIYSVVYALFSLLGPLLRSAMSVLNVGIFNRLLGLFFSLIKNLLWLSIVFNLFLCLSDRSDLLKYESANDGNLVAAVMALTPTILGCYGAEDFAHFHQLKEAKTISCNFNEVNNVIITNPDRDSFCRA